MLHLNINLSFEIYILIYILSGKKFFYDFFIIYFLNDYRNYNSTRKFDYEKSFFLFI